MNEKKIGNKVIVNDSKCTNLISLDAAFRNYDDFLWIAGGVWKNSTDEKSIDLAKYFEKFDKNLFKKIKKAMFFGRDGKKFYEYFKSIGVVSENFENLELLMSSLGDFNTILFAPVCASFDQFNSYADRGELFNNLIGKYLSH